MKLENQVCNLELSKRLKELGVKQESLFHWMDCSNGLIQFHPEPEDFERPKYTVGYLPIHLIKFVDHWSAFTSTELGELLPGHWCLAQRHEWEGKQVWSFIPPIKNEEGYPDLSDEFIDSNTEADARAKMLIYLLENN